MFSLSTGFLSIFAFSGFIYIIVLSILALKGVVLPKWAFVVLFIIGGIGIILAGIMLFVYFLVKLPI